MNRDRLSHWPPDAKKLLAAYLEEELEDLQKLSEHHRKQGHPVCSRETCRVDEVLHYLRRLYFTVSTNITPKEDQSDE